MTALASTYSASAFPAASELPALLAVSGAGRLPSLGDPSLELPGASAPGSFSSFARPLASEAASSPRTASAGDDEFPGLTSGFPVVSASAIGSCQSRDQLAGRGEPFAAEVVARPGLPKREIEYGDFAR